MSKDYVVVTCVNQFRSKYVIHKDDLQNLNPDNPVEIDWAAEAVIAEEIEEFSQLHLGERIIDTIEVTEDDMISMFRTENDYLADKNDVEVVNFVRSSIKV